jgi:hypothetical protein
MPLVGKNVAKDLVSKNWDAHRLLSLDAKPGNPLRLTCSPSSHQLDLSQFFSSDEPPLDFVTNA